MWKSGYTFTQLTFLSASQQQSKELEVVGNLQRTLMREFTNLVEELDEHRVNDNSREWEQHYNKCAAQVKPNRSATFKYNYDLIIH